MKIIAIVKYTDKRGITIREDVFDGPTKGDWPRNLWLQLAAKIFHFYGHKPIEKRQPGSSERVHSVWIYVAGKKRDGALFSQADVERYWQYTHMRDTLSKEELKKIEDYNYLARRVGQG